MNCPNGVYQKEIKEIEALNKSNEFISPGDLARQMEIITEEHLGTFGVRREDLKSENKIWVIAWSEFDIKRLPLKKESLNLKIWAGKQKGDLHSRKYAFYSKNGEILVYASSLFVLMDSKTRSFAEPTEKLFNIPHVILQDEPDHPKMRNRFPEEFSNFVLRVVLSEEIDKNGHLNNTYYLDWAESLLFGSSFQNKIPTYVWIQYSKELLEGQKVTLAYELKGNELYVRGSLNEEIAFLLKLEY